MTRALPQFLDRHPDFIFDPEDFVRARWAIPVLERQYTDFLEKNFARGELWPATSDIEQWLAENAHLSYTAYRNHGCSISALPVFGKAELRADPAAYQDPTLDPHSTWQKDTTGSTGRPIAVLYSELFRLDILYLSIRKVFSRAGINAASHFPAVLSLSENERSGKWIKIDPLDQRSVIVHSVVDTTKDSSYIDAIALLRDLDSPCLSSKPSVLENLLQFACQGQPPQLHSIISGGSHLSDDLRMRLSTTFGCPVINVYGMTEVGIIASECRERYLHVDKSAFFVETIDESGSKVAEGATGELVVSRITNSAMPLLRYKTNDIGAVVTEECSCGVVGPRIIAFHGRKIQCYKLPSGSLFSPTRLNGFMPRFPMVEEFRVTQRRIDFFEFEVQLSSRFIDCSEIFSSISEFLRSVLPPEVSFRVVEQHFRPDSKFQRFRNNI
ncbi:phenylacetate--CoA ligase family protein [Rhizobium ruizarguesonis]|uniref:phenylacetate--CoA ligase family protein n=1 Tax=Rhizobium ruizarguesonis TaxID=2081791 RepID=UPI00103215BE|nr:AMP-binding protein [Rhizobium ruizarguesonis]TBA11987.1 hypothetical protein ELH65_26600 [Rhizobium ruizarguesonis]